VIEIIKGNSTGDDAAYIDAFVNLCGGQSAAFKRMLSVEADKIGHFVRPIAREEAIVHMRDGVAFGENVGTPEDFLSRSRLLLLRSVEGLMHDLSQFRFVYIGDGMWRDDDAVKSAFSMLNSEANGIASSFGYFEFLRRKEQFGENQGPEIVRQRNQILSIAEGNPNEDFVNFFTPDPGEGSFETLLNRLNIFMLDLYTGVTGRDYGDPEFDRIRVVLPGEEMTAYFCKVTNCVIRGDSESLEFEGARRGFLKQFILTARNALVESEGFLGDLSLEFCDRMLAISDADSFERLRVQAREDMRGYFEEITLGLSGEEQWMQDNLEIFSQAFEEASLQVFEELSRNGAYDEENLSQCKENLSQYALEAYEIRTRVHLELPPPPWNLSEFNPFAHLAYS
ncbi:MAG: hypothetical protein LBS87_03490, partial [Puniceicoccales bacterium]|nr:hypothetical protein [Puniceicoccales bacterium]